MMSEPCDEPAVPQRKMPYLRLKSLGRLSQPARRVSTSNGKALLTSVLVVLFATAAFSAMLSQPMAAQDASATPIAQVDLATELGLNAGISLEQLAQGDAKQLPTAPVMLRLEQLGFNPGEQFETKQTTGPELLYVITGELIATDTFGFSAKLSQGAQVLFNPGYGYTLKNEADKQAAIYVLSLRPVAADEGTATPEGEPSPEQPTVLYESQLAQLPPAPATLFLGRMSWQPDADTGQYWQDGVFGIRLEVGNLSLQSPSGLAVPLAPNAAQVIPPRVVHDEVNHGPDTAVAIVFAVVNGSGPIFEPGVPPAEGTPTG
jgi:hypothetical protein